MLAEIHAHDLHEVAELARDNIHAIEGILMWIAIPLALLPPIPTAWKWIWIRTLVITVIAWMTLLNFRIAYEIPWNRIVIDIEMQDSGYDGVGGNVALLLVGWVFPLTQCLITLCLTRFVFMKLAVRGGRTPRREGNLDVG